MYEQRFGLKRRPFPATPDDSLYYPATGHENALACLVRAIRDQEGLALVTGVPGTGKTLIGYCLLERLGPPVETGFQPVNSGKLETCPHLEHAVIGAFLPNSHLADRLALLQAILYDLKLPYEEGSAQVLRLRLTDFLLKSASEGKCTALIVDEAHHLSPDLLEELRLLGNLEAGGKKAIQAILLAQPCIMETLAKPELAAFKQRLVVRTQVDPLGVEEALDYLLHHLRLAGGIPEKIIDEAGLEVLARGTKGIPRLLNQAGHQALLVADAGDLDLVDAEAALEALALLGQEAAETTGKPEAAEETADAANGFDGAGTLRLADPARRPA